MKNYRLLATLEARNLQYTDVTRLCGLSCATVGKAVRGRQPIRRSSRIALANALRVDEAWLFAKDESTLPPVAPPPPTNPPPPAPPRRRRPAAAKP